MPRKTKKQLEENERVSEKAASRKKKKVINFSNDELPKSIDVLVSEFEKVENDLKEYKHEVHGRKWNSSGKEFICVLLIEKHT